MWIIIKTAIKDGVSFSVLAMKLGGSSVCWRMEQSMTHDLVLTPELSK